VIDVLVTVALGGMLALFALAALAGFVDSRSQQSAWNRIAARRRELTEIRDALGEQQVRLEVREEELDARERRLRVREQAVAAAEALAERVRALDRREQALIVREGGAARGPDAA
jgi:flagellar motility protein MotE (MotC chaperone)